MTAKGKTETGKTQTSKAPAIRDLQKDEIDSVSGGWIQPDVQPAPKSPGWIQPDPNPVR